MAQYGDWILSDYIIDPVVSQELLLDQFSRSLNAIYGNGGIPDGKLEFMLNRSFEAYDEETNTVVRGFTHAWKWTSHE